MNSNDDSTLRSDTTWKGYAKRVRRSLLRLHIPVNWATRPFFVGLYISQKSVLSLVRSSLRMLWYEPLFRSQCTKIGDQLEMEQLPYIQGKGEILIGDRVCLSGKPGITFCNRLNVSPVLVIGDGTFLGHRVRISVARKITIGANCLIAGRVTLRDYDGHPVDAAARRAGEFVSPADVRPVEIGDDVWIGSDAQILKGVSVGARSVVAARAVVVRDVPSDVVVAGCPATIVKSLKDGQMGIEDELKEEYGIDDVR